MCELEFTQHLLPNGRQQKIYTKLSQELYDKAQRVIACGYRFEAEILTTGQVSVTVSHPEHGDVDILIIANGPGIKGAVQQLLGYAKSKLVIKQRPLRNEAGNVGR